MQAQLPLLLQELRRHYDVDAFTESALTPQQIEEMKVFLFEIVRAVDR